MIDAALDRLLAAHLIDEDGETVDIEVLAPMSAGEIAGAERALGHTYPPAVRALLSRTRGLNGPLDQIDFSGRIDGQHLEDLFPHIATIASDGWGNFWAVDLVRDNGSWGPIWYLSHDAPVALYQCDGLATFLDELVRMHRPPHASLIDDVHEDRVHRIGRTHRARSRSRMPVSATRRQRRSPRNSTTTGSWSTCAMRHRERASPGNASVRAPNFAATALLSSLPIAKGRPNAAGDLDGAEPGPDRRATQILSASAEARGL